MRMYFGVGGEPVPPTVDAASSAVLGMDAIRGTGVTHGSYHCPSRSKCRANTGPL
jgi:hypothetical protein